MRDANAGAPETHAHPTADERWERLAGDNPAFTDPGWGDVFAVLLGQPLKRLGRKLVRR